MSSLRNAALTTVVGIARHCTRCGCPLSRYNIEPQCGSCTRFTPQQATPRAQVPDLAWADEDLQQALVTRDFGRLCRLVRERGALRQEDISSLTGLSQAFLSNLESGTRRLTNIDKIVQLLEGLEVPADLRGMMLFGTLDTGPTRQASPSPAGRRPA